MLLDPKGKGVLKDKSFAGRFHSQFVVIDPIDRNRNVAAGVSTESLAKFVILCGAFLNNPSIAFFHKKAAMSGGAAALRRFSKEAGLELYVVAAKVPDKSEDIVWPQLRRVSDIIEYHASKHGFSIYFSLQAISKRSGLLAFFAPRQELTSILHKGPSTFNTKALGAFLAAHRKALAFLASGETLSALEQNRYSSLGGFMKDVAAGRVVGRRKDVALVGSRLFINTVPDRYAGPVYAELRKKLMLR